MLADLPDDFAESPSSTDDEGMSFAGIEECAEYEEVRDEAKERRDELVARKRADQAEAA